MIEIKEICETGETSETRRSMESAIPHESKVQLRAIMIATDFSSASDRALEYALSLARRYDAKIYLTHVVSNDAFAMMAPDLAMQSLRSMRQNAAEEFAGLMNTEQWRQVGYTLAIEEGPFWPTMESLIQKFKIDLIVAGTHGTGGVRKFVLGSSAEQIFRQSPVPVLIVGPAVEGESFLDTKFNNILLATDFGPGVEREAAYALSLAREHGARLHLLHVLPPVEDSSEAGLDQAKESAINQMKKLVPPEANRGCWPTYWLATGDPAEQILGMAQATRAGLIVSFSMSCGQVRWPGSMRATTQIGSRVSRPMTPLGAWSSSRVFFSGAWGAWSLAITSSVPSRRPAMMAWMSSSVRSGGDIL